MVAVMVEKVGSIKGRFGEGKAKNPGSGSHGEYEMGKGT
jgi:hypothetical protein